MVNDGELYGSGELLNSKFTNYCGIFEEYLVKKV